MKRWMWLAFALSACGEEPPDLNGDGQADAPGSVTQIAPVHPVASVSGYVYDVATGQAIEGASVSLFASSEHSETTGVDGYVNFSRIAAGGTALFAVAAEGYLSANGTVGIPSQSGDFPSANNHATMGRIGLMRAAPLTTKARGPSKPRARRTMRAAAAARARPSRGHGARPHRRRARPQPLPFPPQTLRRRPCRRWVPPCRTSPGRWSTLHFLPGRRSCYN